MAKKFEELLAWQKSITLTKEIYQKFSFLKDYSFKDQIQRAAVSIPNNIAEGFERGTRKDFRNFLFIARGSCGEVRNLVYIAKELKYLDNKYFEDINKKCEEISKILYGLIKSLKK